MLYVCNFSSGPGPTFILTLLLLILSLNNHTQKVQEAPAVVQAARGQRNRRHVQGLSPQPHQLPKMWSRGTGLGETMYAILQPHIQSLPARLPPVPTLYPPVAKTTDPPTQALHFEPFKQLMLPLPVSKQSIKPRSVVFFPVCVPPPVCEHMGMRA